ncbi:MAG TPA: four helix bundle protein [Bacteroidales bacterium]|nr:four helix bundle protein [Bacteroidales bacterium]HSA43423.1 four helix bundle protein [Bacteroidales bacterium]
MEKRDLEDRITRFAVGVASILHDLKGDSMITVVKNQLFRSSTSVGANYHEAQGGLSLADFRCKIHLSLKELRETWYWLVILRALTNQNIHIVDALINEAEQLKKILGSIVARTRMK